MNGLMPVTWVGGHLFVEPFPGIRALIDTGAGHTASHRRGDGYLGKTLADIEGMANTRIDLLVGMDAFLDTSVLMTREYIEFGAAPISGTSMVLRNGAMPSFEVRLAGDPIPVVARFDSGADKSYIHASRAREFVGHTEDFFPPVGRYSALQFRERILIGGNAIELLPIVPADARIGVTSMQSPLLIGSELLRYGDLWLDVAGGEAIYRHRPTQEGEDNEQGHIHPRAAWRAGEAVRDGGIEWGDGIFVPGERAAGRLREAPDRDAAEQVLAWRGRA